MQTYDAIVLGAGAVGSAAAYYLAKAGQRVLLLEQFEIDHKNGSSYGFSRIIRYSYDDTRYINLAKATYPLWFALEEESGETLYVKTGGIDFGKADEPSLLETIKSVQDANIEHEVLTPAEAEKRLPQFRFDADMAVLYQTDSGMLKASLSVKTHVRMAQQHGATVLDNTPVTGMVIHSDSVEITTDKDTYSAGKLVITPGSWAKQLLAATGLDLPLTVLRCQPAFFQPVNVDKSLYTAPNFPIFIFHRENDLYQAIYGMADIDGYGVKAAFHGGGAFDHPSEIDYTPDDDRITQIRETMGRYLPIVQDGPLVSTRICLYTMTPDHHFIVDQHPEHPHVVIGAGFSGHGFKFSTILGNILSDLALEGTTEHDISLFKITRF